MTQVVDAMALEVAPHRELSVRLDPAGIIEVANNLKVMRQFIFSNEMKDGHDYGKIQGCGDKPTLLNPGAQKICMLFNVHPEFAVDRRPISGNHVEYIVNCALISRTNHCKVAAGVGSCSTMEKKYRWRNAKPICPTCKVFEVNSNKDGFYCWKKIGGCGATFQGNDERITSQKIGRVENEDIADVYNTVLKMAKKRAFVDATLGLSCISEFYTQDLEDFATPAAPEPEPPTPPAPTPKPADSERVVAYKAFVAEMRELSGKDVKWFKETWKSVTDAMALGPNPEKMDAEQYAATVATVRDLVTGTVALEAEGALPADEIPYETVGEQQ
jgi:hypothetical protein